LTLPGKKVREVRPAMSESDRKQRSQLLTLSSVGLMFPVSITIGYYIGRTLDGWFHTGSKLMMAFVIFGVIGSFINLFQEVKRYNRAADSASPDPSDAEKKTHESDK
jgi:F0F1-type ATP synthase assembly protein I